MSPYRSADRDLTGLAAFPDFASERNLYKPRPVVLDSCKKIFSAIVVTQHFVDVNKFWLILDRHDNWDASP